MKLQELISQGERSTEERSRRLYEVVSRLWRCCVYSAICSGQDSSRPPGTAEVDNAGEDASAPLDDCARCIWQEDINVTSADMRCISKERP
jgi:hypothetical protein